MSQKSDNIFAAGSCISRDEMYAYLEGRFSSTEMHRIEKHLLDCEMCSDELEGLRIISKQEFETLEQSIQHKLSDKYIDDKTISIFAYKKTLLVAASILIVLGIGILIKTRTQTYADLENKIAVHEPAKTDEQSYEEAPASIEHEQKKESEPSETEPQQKISAKKDARAEIESQPATVKQEIPLPKVEDEVIMPVPKAIVTDDISAMEELEMVDADIEFEEESPLIIAKEEASAAPPAMEKSEMRSARKGSAVRNKKAKSITATYAADEAEPIASKAVQPDNLSIAIDYYNTKNYRKAIFILESEIKENTNNTEAYYYLGICQYEQKNYGIALENLRKVTEQKQSPRYWDALWYTAHSYKELNNSSAYKATLQLLSQEVNPYQNEAIDILRK